MSSFKRALCFSSIIVISACSGGGGSGGSDDSTVSQQPQSNNETPNPAPVAATIPSAMISGPARAINGEPITLSAAGSKSNNNNSLTYHWRNLTPGDATLEGADTDTVTFYPSYYTDPRRGALSITLELTVNNGEATDTSLFTVTSTANLTANPFKNYATEGSWLAQEIYLTDERIYFVDNGSTFINRPLPQFGKPIADAVYNDINVYSWHEKNIVQYEDWAIVVSTNNLEFVQTGTEGEVLQTATVSTSAADNGASKAFGAVYGDYLAVAFDNSVNGLKIYDISDLPNVSLVSGEANIDYPKKILVSEGKAIVANGSNLYVFNILTDPGMSTPIASSSLTCHDVEFYQDQVFCVKNDYLAKYELEENGNLTASQSFIFENIDTKNSQNFTISKGKFYLYLNTLGLTTTFPLTEDMNILHPEVRYLQTGADYVTDNGTIAAAKLFGGEVATIKVGQLGSAELNTFSEGKSLRYLTMPSANLLAASDAEGSVNFYDISDRLNPKFDFSISRSSLDSQVGNIESYKEGVVSIPYRGGFADMDISDGDNPVQLFNATPTSSRMLDSAYKSTKLQKGHFTVEQYPAVNDEEDYSLIRFLVDGSQWSEFEAPGLVYEITAHGDSLYMASSQGVQIADISLPTAVILSETRFCHGTIYSLDVEESTLVASSGLTLCAATLNENGLPIVDTTSAVDINVGFRGYQPKVVLNDGLAFINGNGVTIYDVGVTRAPEIVGHFSTSGPSNDVEIIDKLIYSADGMGGLTVIENTLDNNPKITQVSGDSGSITYDISWITPAQGQWGLDKVLCIAEVGNCEVGEVNHEKKTAKLIWENSGFEGEAALRVMVGNDIWFNSQVMVAHFD
ncbi:hypothetical protein ACJJH9_02610 [Microbulbifer sp. DLAB2-AF]|uniref:hypothetical protein n=1 Tax=Microbulbifer sp. DLAB2-AF TaxID=3243395 RepID=UPI00403A5B0A